jgi:hypothetical protein
VLDRELIVELRSLRELTLKREIHGLTVE